VFPLDFAALHARAAEPAVFAALVTRYDFDHVVVTKGTFEPTGMTWGELLRKDGRFALVYFDEHGMLWTRERGGAIGCDGCRRFTLLSPWRIDAHWIATEFAKQPFEAIYGELAYALRTSGGSPFLRSMIATLSVDAPVPEPERARLRALATGN
jgi:hypothetical protein